MKKLFLVSVISVITLFQYQVLAQTVTDASGNNYPTVTIGQQAWMKENLRTLRFSNGDAIDDIQDNTTWLNLSTSASCAYGNDTANARFYGRLYNWYAMQDNRGLCPQGWKVPNDSDWQVLFNTLGGTSLAGRKMKTSGPEWQGFGGDNSSSFSALPGGYRWGKTGTTEGEFNALKSVGAFWSSSETIGSGGDWWFVSYALGDTVRKTSRHKSYGFSIRCVYSLPVGLQSLPASELFSVYPNPAAGKFIFTNKGHQDSEVEVFDINGKMVDRFTAAAGKEIRLDYSLLCNGLYVLHIRDQQRLSFFRLHLL